jgi:hypothetical protein
MNALRTLAVASAALVAPLLAVASRAQGPAGQDAGPLLADAGADANPGPPLPVLDADPLPDKRSGLPKEDEWKDAPEVTIHRWAHALMGSVHAPTGTSAICIDQVGCAPPLFAARAGDKTVCHAHRVREWVRVDCATKGGVLLLGGAADGVVLRAGSATFPVRRGDRRELEFLDEETTFTGYKSMEEHHRSAFRFTLSEAWAPGDERPWVAAD